MPLSRRYSPDWAPGEAATIGMDFSAVIPPGVGITDGSLFIQTNRAASVEAGGDFASPDADPSNPGFFIGHVVGRSIYVFLNGGVEGRDYRMTWTVEDTNGNVWPRTALMLCAPTS